MTTEHHKDNHGHNSDEELIARLQRKMQATGNAGSTGFKLNRDFVILIVLVVLVVISGWQAVKLSSLRTTGAVQSVSNPASSSGGSSLPASLKNLPSQVGGC
mgnify:CR=1 FL=1